MNPLSLVVVALVQSPVAPLEPELQERAGRPVAPYSLPPVATQPRAGQAIRLVPPGAPAAVEVAVEPLDDAVPPPAPAVYTETQRGDVLGQPASGDPYFLGFAGRLHYPPAGELVDAELYDSALAIYPDGRPSPETYAFVMFSKRMTEPRLGQLEALGCRLLGFHPHYTQKVAIPAGAIDAVAALPFVRWVGVPKQDQKLHPALMSELATVQPNQPLDLWVSVYESDVGPSSVRETIPGSVRSGPGGGTVAGEPIELKHVWVTNGWQQHALEAAGVEVIDFAERASAFRVRALPEAIDLVTSLDFVQFVEPDSPSRPMHDETMPMVNADDARKYFDGGVNQRAIVGIADSGIEAAHQDLDHFWGTGTNLSGGAGNAWDDACGHGTHVAGTVIGNGDANDDHTGAAPGLGWGPAGELYNARILDGCGKQSVNIGAVIGFMTSPSSSPIPHVINNSWGADGNAASPWVGTESSCQLYDANAYDDAQLNVFAAGNEGSASLTIGRPAVAKNVLTVGSALDFNAGSGPPGSIVSSSSRGPAGDGRWKPNVCAPGDLVTSADAFNLSGYTEKSGTSMATPHVTGVVAQLIDSNAAFAYLPERISAHMMATAHARNNQLLLGSPSTHLNDFGTGRIDATRAIWGSGGSNAHWAFSLGAGGSTYSDFTVPSGATRLVAVMHYVEPSASSGASQALINDWDFTLDQPPIDPAGNTGEWTAQHSALDNTEIRVLPNPSPGTWRWKIWPASTSTTAYFGVSVYVQTTDDTPALSPTLTKSDPYLRPLEIVDMDYYLGTTEGSISSTFLATSTDGGTLVGARTMLADGVVTDLLDNMHNGGALSLGNIDPFFQRQAEWTVYWATEGSKNFGVQVTSDNASNSPTVLWQNVIVDGTAPYAPTSLTSTSHTPWVWSNDDTIDYAWTASWDPSSGGAASGLDGYSILETTGAPGTPATVINLGAVTSYTTAPLSTSTTARFFNIRPVDRSGNWGSTNSIGGYLIDTWDPGTASNISSSTHTLGVPSCEDDISLTWTGAPDTHSGIAGYSVLVSNSAITTPDETIETATTSYATTLPWPAQWYVHIRAVDNAGNVGPKVTQGPYPYNGLPVYTYCTAKVNSQGCTPAISSSGTPSFSGGGFQVTASNVLNNKSGLLFWGYAASGTPFQGGTKCVANPVRRTPIQNSGGNPPPDDCSGTYSFNFSNAYMTSKGINQGDRIYAQFWTRDPAAPFSTGLTDALYFDVCQ